MIEVAWEKVDAHAGGEAESQDGKSECGEKKAAKRPRRSALTRARSGSPTALATALANASMATHVSNYVPFAGPNPNGYVVRVSLFI